MSRYIKLATSILVLLPVAQILEDIITFKIGPCIFHSNKVCFTFGGSTFIRYLHPRLISSIKIGSPVLKLFFLYSFIQICSLTYANGITISQKINYFLLNFSSLVIIYSLSRLFLKADYRYFINKFSLILKYIFFLSFVFFNSSTNY